MPGFPRGMIERPGSMASMAGTAAAITKTGSVSGCMCEADKALNANNYGRNTSTTLNL
jgi:hypothetical protein